MREERRGAGGEDVYGFHSMLKQHFSISPSVPGAAANLAPDIKISRRASRYRIYSTVLFPSIRSGRVRNCISNFHLRGAVRTVRERSHGSMFER